MSVAFSVALDLRARPPSVLLELCKLERNLVNVRELHPVASPEPRANRNNKQGAEALSLLPVDGTTHKPWAKNQPNETPSTGRSGWTPFHRHRYRLSCFDLAATGLSYAFMVS